MKAIECNKAYLGTKEIAQGSAFIGDQDFGLIYTSMFRKLGDYYAGDAVVWDTQSSLFRVTSPENIYMLDTTRFVPTGVVAIPSSHDVYGTGEAGVMALMSASLKTPDTGQSTNKDISWNGYGEDLLELIKYKKVNTITYDEINSIVSSEYQGWLPSDAFSGGLSLDNNTRYSNSGFKVPSPYNADGSRNEIYFATGPVPTIEPVFGPPQPATVDGLNFNWTVQSGNWNESANSDAKDGKQFTSVSPGSNGSTVIRCTFSGKVGKITFACKFDGESSYDYLTIGELDKTCDRSTFGTSLKGKSGKLQKLSFDIPDDGEHYVEFCYSKDSSGDTAPDCAVVYVDGGTIVNVITVGQSGSGSDTNLLADFDGKANTALLCSKATAQPDWKTATSIVDTNSLDAAGYYATACTCWRYHTTGTSQGDWYLPTCGEFGYVCVRQSKINNTITLLQDHFNTTLCQLSNERIKRYWTSQRVGNNLCWYIEFFDGHITYGPSNSNYFVRPFTRLK